jgi:hypothetical protein
MVNIGTLLLTELAKGLPAITPEFGSVLAQASAVCFEDQNHQNGVELGVEGTYQAKYRVFWQEVTDQMRRNWNDIDKATEHGAYGVAFLLISDLTEYTIADTSRRGTGFDYWLGKKENNNGLPFQNKARLEVSGIRKGTDSIIASRVKQKLEQVGVSDSTSLPAYVVVVEFNTPVSQVVKK